MRRIAKPGQTTNLDDIVAEKISSSPPSDISITRLIEDGLIILYREIKNLLSLSSKGKLDKDSARDLRDHLKLLFELKAQEDSMLKGLTDEELEQQVKSVFAPTKDDSNDSNS